MGEISLPLETVGGSCGWRMPVLAEPCIALLFGLLAVEVESASRQAFRAYNDVTDQVLLLDPSLGRITVLVVALSMNMVTGLLFQTLSPGAGA